MSTWFPECRYEGDDGFNGEDATLFKVTKELSMSCRELFRNLVRKDFECVAVSYAVIQSLFDDIMEMPPCDWNDRIDCFFLKLSDFLMVHFTVKEAKDDSQWEYETSAARILSDACSDHTHKGCPFHVEDNFTHCCMCMFRILSRYDEFSEEELFQKAVCALFHDIGKLNTLTMSKNGKVGYPCHCLAGSITLRHMWGPHFLPWFSAKEYDHMCDMVLYHMCGMNRNPTPVTITGLSLLPKELRKDLADLAKADLGGAFPRRAYVTDVPSLSEDHAGLQAMEELASVCSLTEFMNGNAPGCPHKMRGILIVLMGQSACGKGHTANAIKEQLLGSGVQAGVIRHLQRDVYIVETGAKLLGKDPHEVSYKDAYDEISRVALKEKEAGVKGQNGIRSKISLSMANTAGVLLNQGFVVLFDTMQTHFASSRSLILPSAATHALRLYVYPVRTTLITEADCQRHDMSFANQLSAAGPFNVLCPLNEGMKGNTLFGLTPVKCVFATTDPAKSLVSQNPHFVFTISTAVRNGQQLPNTLLHTFINQVAIAISASKIARSDCSENLPIYYNMNMEQLLNYLDKELSPSEHASREDKTTALREWFSANQYTVSMPFQIPCRVAQYMLAVIDGDEKTANDLHGRLVGASTYLPPTSQILGMSREEIFKRVKRLEALLSTCIVIKYKDGINRQWTSPWNVQSRSPICIFVQEKWRVVSAMPRGPEIAGHKEHGVSNLQDLNVENEEDIAHFAPHYQTCIRAMQGNVEEGMKISENICSSKRDGMCFRVSYLAPGTPECRYWQHAIQQIEDEFVQLFVSESRVVFKGGLLLPASNGTAILTQKEVQYWMVCAMALSYGISHNELLVASSRKYSPREVLLMSAPSAAVETDMVSEETPTLIQRFLVDMAQIAGKSAPVEIHAWEAIGGPNRMCAFDSSPHSELACNYEEAQCGLSYLGLAVTSDQGDLTWIPHFNIQHNFFEPTFWRMENCTATRLALDELARVFGGEISWDDFFAMYPPGNRIMTKAVLPDAEGFVVYLKMTAFGKPDEYVYCKAKTWMYYVLHKIRPHNIPAILRMPEKFGEAFPGYRAVREFFGEGEQRAANLIEDLTVFVMSEAMLDDLPTKALQALQKVSPDVAFKIVLNNSKRAWDEGCVRVAGQHFTAFANLSLSDCSGDNLSQRSGRGVENVSNRIDICDSHSEGELSGASLSRKTASKKKEEAAMLLRAMLMTLECYREDWRDRLTAQFDVDNISRRGEMPKVAGMLWDFIHGS